LGLGCDFGLQHPFKCHWCSSVCDGTREYQVRPGKRGEKRREFVRGGAGGAGGILKRRLAWAISDLNDDDDDDDAGVVEEVPISVFKDW